MMIIIKYGEKGRVESCFSSNIKCALSNHRNFFAKFIRNNNNKIEKEKYCSHKMFIKKRYRHIRHFLSSTNKISCFSAQHQRRKKIVMIWYCTNRIKITQVDFGLFLCATLFGKIDTTRKETKQLSRNCL